jgi:hypothetical protein
LNATLVRIQCEADFFLFCRVHNPLNFEKIFFACVQKYPLEISTATGVIDHAESESAIIFARTLILQNRSTVIWSKIIEV